MALAFVVPLDNERLRSAVPTSFTTDFGFIWIIFLDLPGGGGRARLSPSELLAPAAIALPEFEEAFDDILWCFSCSKCCSSSISSSLSFLFCWEIVAPNVTEDGFLERDGGGVGGTAFSLVNGPTNCAGIGAIAGYDGSGAEEAEFPVPGDGGEGGYRDCLHCRFFAGGDGVT